MVSSSFSSNKSSSKDLWISRSSSDQPKVAKTKKYFDNKIAGTKRRLFECIDASFRMEHSYRSKMGELRKKSLNREKREELERATDSIYRNCRKEDLEFAYLKALVRQLDQERTSLFGTKKDY